MARVPPHRLLGRNRRQGKIIGVDARCATAARRVHPAPVVPGRGFGPAAVGHPIHPRPLESPPAVGTIPGMNAARPGTIVLSLLPALAGCTTTPQGERLSLADGQELPIIRQTSGTYSSIGRSLRLVIHDARTLAMLPIDVGPVDFTKEMVLVAALGPTPSDEFGVRIQRVWREGAVLRASVDVRYPPIGAPLRSVQASPYHAAVVPNSPLNLRNFEVQVAPATGTRHARGGS